MTRFFRSGSVLALATAFGCMACRDARDLARRNPPPAQRIIVRPDQFGSGQLGMNGYERPFLRPGYTGDGSMLSAGLNPSPPARGGGPGIVTRGAFVPLIPEPRGLAPQDHIGTPSSNGDVHVIVDPAMGTTALYSRRAR